MPPALGSLRLAVLYASASAEASIGGNFYEALETPHGVRLLVGDVRGKGLDAVRLAEVVPWAASRRRPGPPRPG